MGKLKTQVSLFFIDLSLVINIKANLQTIQQCTALSLNLSPNPNHTHKQYRFRTVPFPNLTRTRPYQFRGKIESSVIWPSTGTVEYGSQSERYGDKFGESVFHIMIQKK